jgi:Putative adhesin
MPTFETPELISATVEVVVADVRVTARDRTDTVVDVRPSDPSHEPDVRAAEQTRVEMTSDGLLVKAPKQRGISMLGKPGSIDVTIELPEGSRLRADGGVMTLWCTGRLGECQAKTGAGKIELENTGPVDLTSSAGDISVGVATGGTEISSGSGRVRLAKLDGPATVRNANGETWIGTVTGNLQVSTSNGSISIDRADGDVTARTANGSLRVGRVSRGMTSLKTSMGEIEVGIAAGTAALVDAQTRLGNVRNSLAATDSPEPADETAEVHARTSFGDIVIRRA